MNEIPRDEIIDSYSVDEKWVQNEIFGNRSLLAYILAGTLSLVFLALYPIFALIVYIGGFCIINVWARKDIPKDIRKILLRGYTLTFLALGFLTLLDNATFGLIDRVSKTAKSMALKTHEYKKKLYSFI